MKLSSHNIELFLAVVDGGSFSAAARALRRAPSAVSMAMASIEAELGIVLFDRGAREAVPTPAATALMPHARLIAEQLKQLHLHVQELSQGLESRISLGIAAELDHAPFLAAVRALAHQADPDVVEEVKWRGVPVWSHAGMICTGETYQLAVKLTFAKGAALPDPAGLFNASLEGNTRRAIDLHEGAHLDAAAFKALIRAAVALNTAPKSKRTPT